MDLATLGSILAQQGELRSRHWERGEKPVMQAAVTAFHRWSPDSRRRPYRELRLVDPRHPSAIHRDRVDSQCELKQLVREY